MQPATSTVTVDGNEAAANVAHRLTDTIVIYPITPSSPMGELADEWSARGRTNLWGQVPQVVEMQSEAGAIGAVHGALQSGALATTFTASQGLLLMIPNLYKIAGELLPFCIHVAARTVATHALSIFGDHSDIYACRQTGVAQLCSASVQEAHDFAAVGHSATLLSRVPVMHFFDGFRTSHEETKMRLLSDDDLRALISEQAIADHRERALSPDRPKVRGTAQNPDTFFQAREAANPYYLACPGIIQAQMDALAQGTGRQYHLFDYEGHPDAERVIVIMGSGAETVHETVDHLVKAGEKVGVVKVRLYRPFDVGAFLAALPTSVQRIAVLDRTKEPGSIGEPLYLDVVAALFTGRRQPMPQVVGGRYGLSSKEFTPAMVKAVFDNLAADEPKDRFTVGIVDDVTHTSLEVDPNFDIEPDDVVRAVFFGLGSDGTVGANKNSIKIIGDETDFHVQGYFVYDSKKSGAMTVSHLRFGPRPIRSAYLVRRAGFVACHQFNFLEKYDVLDVAAPGGVLLLNAPFPPEQVWHELPREVQAQIIEKRLRLYAIDAYSVAREAGMGGRINTIMQTCFFALAGVLPRDEAIACIKRAIEKTYGRKGEHVVRQNFAAVDAALSNLHEIAVPDEVTAQRARPPLIAEDAPDFVKKVTAVMMAGKGDLLPVSAFPVDGTWPVGTTRFEKRSIALDIPIWEPELCIQCNKCALVCPHAAIRTKVYEPEALEGSPKEFRSVDYKAPDLRGLKLTIQVAPDDCTGCNLCVSICPGKDRKNPERKALVMEPKLDHADVERESFRFFEALPTVDRERIRRIDAKGSQFFEPLFEFSGACAGCGETPYVKLLTQLFGDRLMVANATGCSSIFGGNLPTTPYCANSEGRGPAWANSLFEDNAEFGLGFRLAIEQHTRHAQALLQQLAPRVGDELVGALLSVNPGDEASLHEQRRRVAELRRRLVDVIREGGAAAETARRLDGLADYLVRKSVWLVGGDGWAYDIGYGGLDHVLSLDHDVNILVLDTEVYSNTGGQASKATPLGAAARFAAAGKAMGKKDLGLMAMNYGHVYVASIALGANDNHAVKTMMEAEAYPGPSLVIAYSHCIAHGYDLGDGLEHHRKAVEAGLWPLYRYDPRRAAAGEPPLTIDSRAGKGSVADYMQSETRFRMIEKQDPQRYRELVERVEQLTRRRLALYQHLAQWRPPADEPAAAPTPAPEAQQAPAVTS